MTRKTGNWLIEITRLNPDGTRDYIGMEECDKWDSARRIAATHTRTQENVHATIYDTFNRGAFVAQYWKGHKVACPAAEWQDEVTA